MTISRKDRLQDLSFGPGLYNIFIHHQRLDHTSIRTTLAAVSLGWLSIGRDGSTTGGSGWGLAGGGGATNGIDLAYGLTTAAGCLEGRLQLTFGGVLR
jgi:hypothetical protein